MRIITVVTLFGLLACIYCETSQGYVVNEADGKAYRLVYEAKPWDAAREYCKQDGGKLAVPKTQEEFNFVQKIVRGMQYQSIVGGDYKLLAWLGVHNRPDYRVWRNVDDENVNDTGFNQFAGHNGDGYSDDPAEPHCVGIDAINPGYRSYWCHKNQPFVCQK